jgi:hypothetical protein
MSLIESDRGTVDPANVRMRESYFVGGAEKYSIEFVRIHGKGVERKPLR